MCFLKALHLSCVRHPSVKIHLNGILKKREMLNWIYSFDLNSFLFTARYIALISAFMSVSFLTEKIKTNKTIFSVTLLFFSRMFINIYIRETYIRIFTVSFIIVTHCSLLCFNYKIPEQTGGTPSHFPSDWQVRTRYPASYLYAESQI